MLVKSFVLCEQVRIEKNDKFMLLGVFRTDVVINNLPATNRWTNPLFFGALVALKIDRDVDSGLYVIKAEADNGTEITPEQVLDIRKEGASYIQLPVAIALQLKGPSGIRLNLYKKDSMDLVTELGRFTVVDAADGGN